MKTFRSPARLPGSAQRAARHTDNLTAAAECVIFMVTVKAPHSLAVSLPHTHTRARLRPHHHDEPSVCVCTQHRTHTFTSAGVCGCGGPLGLRVVHTKRRPCRPEQHSLQGVIMRHHNTRATECKQVPKTENLPGDGSSRGGQQGIPLVFPRYPLPLRFLSLSSSLPLALRTFARRWQRVTCTHTHTRHVEPPCRGEQRAKSALIISEDTHTDTPTTTCVCTPVHAWRYTRQGILSTSW